MTQKLSAWNYIKNNKRRVSVLIVSLFLCFMASYIIQIMLGATEVSFRKIYIDNYSKMQYIELAASSFGIDVEHTLPEEVNQIYDEENEKLTRKLCSEKGVKKVWYIPIINSPVAAVVGNIGMEVPLVEKTEDVETIMKHMGAKLVEGKLPQKPGEVVIDEASVKNNHYRIRGYLNEDNYEKDFTISGIVSCDSYFGAGLVRDGYSPTSVCVLSDGSIYDMSKVLERNGIKIRDNYDGIFDRKTGEKWIKEEVVDMIDSSTTFISAGVLILLFLALFIVYTMYLRDRHSEWCLYCSIGYSRRSIYFSILRELLFDFISSLLIGGVMIVLLGKILEMLVISPQGLFCRFWYPEVLVRILCAYTFLFGLLQIPVWSALYRIRTIDAMDDDMY